MATINPFADDNVKGDIWEQGYLAGFAEPQVEHFRPFAPELLEVYKVGQEGGRNDHSEGPSGGGAWAEAVGEVGEHALIHAVGMALEKVVGAAGGLVALVLTVVTIPGDVMLPLPEDFSGPSDEEDATYFGVCPRTDHSSDTEGVTSDGYWIGPIRGTWFSAAEEMKAHGHAEAFVARCSLEDGTCGAVWAVQ
jgi:hypothetical protein